MEDLSKRENTILQELMDGGRVTSIADKLHLSQHTVRNHIRNIFSKLGVNSQAQLIAFAKENPEILDKGVNSSTADSDLKRLLEQDEASFSGLHKQVTELFSGEAALTPAALKSVFRLALPLDDIKVAAWRLRFSLWAREVADEEGLQRRAVRLSSRRELVKKRIGGLRDQGVLRDNLIPEEVLDTLFSTINGVALELLRNPSDENREKQLHLIDVYIDSIIAPDKAES